MVIFSSRPSLAVPSSLANIMEQVERGDGLLHQLIYDPRYARQVSATLADVRGTAEHARRAGHETLRRGGDWALSSQRRLAVLVYDPATAGRFLTKN